MYTVFAVAVLFSRLFMNTYLNSVHSKMKINRLIRSELRIHSQEE